MYRHISDGLKGASVGVLQEARGGSPKTKLLAADVLLRVAQQIQLSLGGVAKTRCWVFS